MTRGTPMLGRLGSAPNIGIGISRGEIRFVGINHAGLLIWNRSISRGRPDTSLTSLIAKGLGERPATLRGRARVACVVGPAEAQLRPLHGLPHLRSAAEQIAVVTASLDRFFVSEGVRLRVSPPVRAHDELWAAAVSCDVVSDVARACREQRVRLVGVAPIAAALGHLARPPRSSGSNEASAQAHVGRVDDGTCLHVVYDAHGMPTRLWRERTAAGVPSLVGDVELPARIDPYFADAFAATRLRAHHAFVIGEHSDDVQRARHARRRTGLWVGVAVASMLAAAVAPAVLALRRAEQARTRLASLATKQRELRQAQGALAAATTTLNSIAAFDASRRSATLLLAELAMAIPDSTAITTLHADSLGGTITVLAPHAAGTLEAIAGLPLVARAQMTGAVTREVTGGVELERASLRFTFQGRKRGPAVVSPRDTGAHLAVIAGPPTAVPPPTPTTPTPLSTVAPAHAVARGGTQ